MTELVADTRASARVPPGASQISLVDLLDRLLGTGVVLAGDVIISLAGVDLVEIRLNALITSVRADVERIALAGEVRND
jgi:hypothetical protein